MTRMKDLARVELPREKLAKYGAAKLTDEELLAIVLGSGIRGTNVLALARAVLKVVRRVGVGALTLERLCEVKGLGAAKAAQVLAVVSLGERLSERAAPELLSPRAVWQQCADIRTSKREHFVAFYLDTQSTLIERQIISVGTLNNSLVHPREVFEPALRLSAAAVLVAHNHPSGAPEPSAEDIAVTERLREAGKVLGVRLLDHVIVTKTAFRSIT